MQAEYRGSTAAASYCAVSQQVVAPRSQHRKERNDADRFLLVTWRGRDGVGSCCLFCRGEGRADLRADGRLPCLPAWLRAGLRPRQRARDKTACAVRWAATKTACERDKMTARHNQPNQTSQDRIKEIARQRKTTQTLIAGQSSQDNPRKTIIARQSSQDNHRKTIIAR